MTSNRFSHPRALVLLLAVAPGAQAATTWTVTSANEAAALGTNTDCPSAATCTLRSAINQAVSGDTIVFAKALDGATISLTKYTNCLSTTDASSATCLPLSPWPPVPNDFRTYVSQFGPSAFFIAGKTLTIDGTANGLTRGIVIARSGVGGTPNFRLFDVDSGSSLTLRGLTLSNGVAQGFSGGGGAVGAGGAIFNQGTLIAARCTFVNNSASGGQGGAGYYGGGGGVGNPGKVNSGFGGGPNGGAAGASALGGYPGGVGGGGGSGSNNSDSGGVGGFGGGGGVGGYFGGIGGSGDFYDGDGGGGGGGGEGGFGNVGGPGGKGGFGSGGGGGGNSDSGTPGAGGAGGVGGGAGGGVAGGNGIGGGGGGGGGLGGGLFNHAGQVTLTNVTFSANAANGGGGGPGGVNGGLRGGGGAGFGGAIFSRSGSLTLDFVTLSGNSAAAGVGYQNGIADGGAIFSREAALTINHSIVVGSSGVTNDVVVYYGSGSGTGNAIGIASGFTSNNPVSGATILGALPATLHGGSADVMIPQAGSAAIDALPLGACNSLVVDQRGSPRPAGVGCDAGAVEVSDTLFRNGFEAVP